MSERSDGEPDFRLTGDDPMLEQIESATSTPASSGDQADDGAWSLPSPPTPADQND
jgi:hypothetical protein